MPDTKPYDTISCHAMPYQPYHTMPYYAILYYYPISLLASRKPLDPLDAATKYCTAMAGSGMAAAVGIAMAWHMRHICIHIYYIQYINHLFYLSYIWHMNVAEYGIWQGICQPSRLAQPSQSDVCHAQRCGEWRCGSVSAAHCRGTTSGIHGCSPPFKQKSESLPAPGAILLLVSLYWYRYRPTYLLNLIY